MFMILVIECTKSTLRVKLIVLLMDSILIYSKSRFEHLENEIKLLIFQYLSFRMPKFQEKSNYLGHVMSHVVSKWIVLRFKPLAI